MRLGGGRPAHPPPEGWAVSSGRDHGDAELEGLSSQLCIRDQVSGDVVSLRQLRIHSDRPRRGWRHPHRRSSEPAVHVPVRRPG